jgi:hypothetical protein
VASVYPSFAPDRATWAPNWAPNLTIVRNKLILKGRLAQLVRAPALQAGGRRFESCTAHHLIQMLL